jgi:voltage-gated potassium channel Kch
LTISRSKNSTISRTRSTKGSRENVFSRRSGARTEFQDRAFFTGIEAENLMFAGETITHRLNLDDATVSEQINFGSAEVAELQAEGVEASTVTLIDATVRDGRIEIPPHDDFTCNLTRTTLGNVIFGGSHDRFESVLFSKTRFDGFNFDIDPHREALESVDWNIHEPARAVAEPGRTFEVTYARAKEGAKGMGDMIAASQFFVHQMRQRRRNHRQEIVQSDRGIIARGAAAVKYVSNGSLDLTTAYGERPRRVVGLSLLTIVGFAALYPFTAGLKVSGEILSHETAGVSAFPKSLYFSVVTFTTVGYGDIQPAGSLAQGLAGFEAFLGAFLMALLVFVDHGSAAGGARRKL